MSYEFTVKSLHVQLKHKGADIEFDAERMVSIVDIINRILSTHSNQLRDVGCVFGIPIVIPETVDN